jgi:sulfate/thiosulfate transport system substrate-binding protein
MSRFGGRVKLLGGAGAILALVVALVASACGGTSSAAGEGSGGGKLTLVAYSTPQEAYEAIIPAFQKTPEGKDVEFEQSYGASGEQSRAVEAGLPADVVEFALDSDITRLVDAGLVDSDWNQNEYKGILTDSVVAFVVRKGNPDNIQTWDDLLKPGVEVITPNPFTSGGARWNIMAAYGAQIKQGKSKEEAVAYLNELFQHVAVQDASARDALQTFTGGKGDVLLSYENEAITAQQKGEDVDYVIPDQTILIENPVAVTTDAPESAGEFVKFLYSDEAQKIFGEKGYRPVVKSVADQFDYETPTTLFTIQEFGGWGTVKDDFFDPENGIVAKIEMSLGVSTDSG